MAKRKTKKQKTVDKQFNYVILASVVLVIMAAGAMTEFTAFGVESGWEADVQLDGIFYGNDFYPDGDSVSAIDPTAFPTARIIKADFDGNHFDSHSLTETINYGSPSDLWFGEKVYQYFEYNDIGMGARVDYSVGQFFLTDAAGNAVTEYYGVWENITDTFGLMHYYFGFSVGFTTRAELTNIPFELDSELIHGAVGLGYKPENEIIYRPFDSDIAWKINNVPELAPVSLRAIVDIRVDDFTGSGYHGVVNEVTVKDYATRYTISALDSGVDSDMDTFNLAYDWKDYSTKGEARPLNVGNPVEILYDVIDSDVENHAQIKTGAYLRPGMDANGVRFDDAVYVGPETYELSGEYVYNVELIYNFICDITINDIPIVAMGEWMSGRVDQGFVPPPEPPTFWEEYWWVLVVVGIVVIGGGGKKANERRE